MNIRRKPIISDASIPKIFVIQAINCGETVDMYRARLSGPARCSYNNNNNNNNNNKLVYLASFSHRNIILNISCVTRLFITWSRQIVLLQIAVYLDMIDIFKH